MNKLSIRDITDPAVAEKLIETLDFVDAARLIQNFHGKAKRDLIMASPHHQRLIQEMPLEDFYFLVKHLFRLRHPLRWT